ncbi:MAG: transposase [Gammaproteobacteria bacterium]|nr:transposase [Gammaproteobacteria bacterium]
MARPLRLEFHGALYHVTSRGDGREAIYLDDEDRKMHLAVLADVVKRFNWAIHAWCQMGNHYHLLIETPEANLARGMRQFNGVYTQRFNRRHGRVGHVFQGRYKAIIVQKDSYLLELARYIVLNPVRAGMVRSVKDWPWSSYRATAGLAESPQWFDTEWLLSNFSTRKRQAKELYKKFVAQGRNQPSPWEQLRNQIYLGDEQFIEKLQSQLPKEQDLSEVPLAQRRQSPHPLDYYDTRYIDRDQAINMAYQNGHTLKAVGEHFNLHYSRISRIVAAAEKAKSKT